MTEYVKRSDACDSFCKAICGAIGMLECREKGLACCELRYFNCAMPSADVIEVVRCRDCEHRGVSLTNVGVDKYVCELGGLWKEDDSCSKAKKKGTGGDDG